MQVSVQERSESGLAVPEGANQDMNRAKLTRSRAASSDQAQPKHHPSVLASTSRWHHNSNPSGFIRRTRIHKLKFCSSKGSDQPPAQDALVGHEVQSDTEIQELTRSFEDGSRMIEEMAQSLPKPPAAPSECLHQYLTSLQHSVTTDLDRLGPHLKGQGLTLVERYHCHMFSLLDDLLQKINDTRSLFILIKWVLQSYLR